MWRRSQLLYVFSVLLPNAASPRTHTLGCSLFSLCAQLCTVTTCSPGSSITRSSVEGGKLQGSSNRSITVTLPTLTRAAWEHQISVGSCA
jgi:hypothetical protein